MKGDREGKAVGKCVYCGTLQLDSDRRCFACGAPLLLPNEKPVQYGRDPLNPAGTDSMAWGYVLGHPLVSWRI